jgi:hypothetical protein
MVQGVMVVVGLSSEAAVVIKNEELILSTPTHMTTTYQCMSYNDKINHLALKLQQEEHFGIETLHTLARLLADRDFFIFHKDELMVIQ